MSTEEIEERLQVRFEKSLDLKVTVLHHSLGSLGRGAGVEASLGTNLGVCNLEINEMNTTVI